MITLEASYSEFSSCVMISLFSWLETGVEPSRRPPPPPDAKVALNGATQVAEIQASVARWYTDAGLLEFAAKEALSIIFTAGAPFDGNKAQHDLKRMDGTAKPSAY